MGADTIVVVALVVFLVLLVMEVPVAFALGGSGAVGLILLRSFDVASAQLGQVPFQASSSFTLTIVPMYILIGMFALHGYVAHHVYQVANYAFARVSGGLGVATVAACGGFAAVTGSSVATAATVSKLSINEMAKYGYDRKFSAGIVAAGGTLGVLIPPSVLLVLYSILTGESIARMLAAGIVPGIISLIAYALYVVFRVRRSSRRGVRYGAAQREGVPRRQIPFLSRVVMRDGVPALPYRGVFRIGLIFFIVIGGIYSGQFTATESGAIGAFAAFVIMVVELRRDGFRSIGRGLRDSLAETASVTSMAFAILVGSLTFTFFLVSARVPARFTEFVGGLPISPWIVLIVILLAMIPLGMALETLSILMITVPLTYPIATGLGFDGIWFGILIVKMIEIGLITPPVGINVYVVAGSVPELSVEDAFRGVVPFLVIDLMVVALLFAVPELTLWLPNRI